MSFDVWENILRSQHVGFAATVNPCSVFRFFFTALLKIILLQHRNELHLRVQEMEPGIAEIGKTVEEAMELEKEHNECLAKLQVRVR